MIIVGSGLAGWKCRSRDVGSVVHVQPDGADGAIAGLVTGVHSGHQKACSAEPMDIAQRYLSCGTGLELFWRGHEAPPSWLEAMQCSAGFHGDWYRSRPPEAVHGTD